MVFKWNFPLIGTYWDGGRHPAAAHRPRRKAAGTSSRARRSRSSTTTAPTARSRSRCWRSAARCTASSCTLLPVTHPGVEQKATWLQIRQSRPDYVLPVGLGRDELAPRSRKRVATGYPREKMYGVWWSGAEPDVKDVGDGAKGYNALALQHGAEPNAKVDEGHPGHGARQGPGHGPEGRSRPGAVHARPVGGDAGRRRRAPRAGALRQGQGDDRRAGALGLREPGARPEASSTRWASPA